MGTQRSLRLLAAVALLIAGVVSITAYSDVIAADAITATAAHGWQSPDLIEPPNGAVRAVSCTSTDFCMAVDSLGNASEFDGTEWLPQTPTRGDDRTALASITCASPMFCVAIDGDGGAVQYDGTGWSALPVPHERLLAVSCVSASFCMGATLVAGQPLATIWNGRKWTHERPLDVIPSSISCASTSFCVAVDPDEGATIYRDGSWGERQDFGRGRLVSVSCPTANFCAASGNGHVLTFDGTAWSKVTDLASRLITLTQISCSIDGSCVVVAGRKYATYAHGQWSALTKFTTGELWGVSCISATWCLAVQAGGTSTSLTFDGLDWTQGSQIGSGGATGLQGVSCPSPTFCAAVDAGGYAMTYDGTTWSDRVAVARHPLAQVNCTSATFCLAITSHDNQVVVYDGSTWSKQGEIPGDEFETQVSCSSAHFCMALEDDGTVYVYDGSHWAQAESALTRSGAVSCGSSTFCVTGDYNGPVQIWDGTSFRTDPSYPLGGLTSVTCTPSRFCIAIGSGAWTSYADGAWSRTGGSFPRSFLSCASARLCAATTDDALARIYRHGAWSRAKELVPGHDAGTARVSCASAHFCMAVTYYGYAVAYR